MFFLRRYSIIAPQWVSKNLNPEGTRFEVAFKCIDDIIYIKFPRESLVHLIHRNKNIYQAMQSVLGLHTARALLRSMYVFLIIYF